MSIQLRDYQLDAVKRMQNGCILCGGVGSGKSRTALAYYYKEQGGVLDVDKYVEMKNPKDLYIITTARKRDTLEWEGEMAPFLITSNPELTIYYNHKVVVDSWNNIGKYKDVEDAFFIFDEQRVVGSGAWVKSFLKITKANDWILLSATPGDTWQDYIPVFIANGFYKNRTEFTREHIVYARFSKYPKIERYLNTGRLIRLRNRILIDMDFVRTTTPHHEDVYTQYNTSLYKDTIKQRKDFTKFGFVPCRPVDEGARLIGVDIDIKDVHPILEGWHYEPREGECVRFEYKPFKTASELCHALRRIVNTDESRQVALLEILEDHPRAIVFYNFDYERELLYAIAYRGGYDVAEWSGHAHQPIPKSDRWVYLVQYTAGAEGWNCITTDTIIFYSQNYSYKIMQQSAGRIDRLNTPYTDLYYYHMKSRSGIDLAISRALHEKIKFNERKWANW